MIFLHFSWDSFKTVYFIQTIFYIFIVTIIYLSKILRYVNEVWSIFAISAIETCSWCCNKLAEGVKYNSANNVFQTLLRVLYYNPLCNVEETWQGHKFLPLLGMLLAVLLEYIIFNSAANLVETLHKNYSYN